MKRKMWTNQFLESVEWLRKSIKRTGYGAFGAVIPGVVYSDPVGNSSQLGFKTTTLLSLNPALTLALFQLYRRVLTRASATTGANPSPRQAFLGAAVSNSIGMVSHILSYSIQPRKFQLQLFYILSCSPKRGSKLLLQPRCARYCATRIPERDAVAPQRRYPGRNPRLQRLGFPAFTKGWKCRSSRAS